MFKILTTIIFIAVSLNQAAAQNVSKDQWLTVMKTALPAALCNSAQYFRQCFDVTAMECEEAAASTTRICLADLESNIPEILVQPRDGTYWGSKVGECSGNAYEVSLIKKRITSAKCNDISNWQ